MGWRVVSQEATILGRVVEGAWRENYVEQLALAGASQGGISRAHLHRDGVEATGRTHMFHASMALPPDHEKLTDEQWHTLAHEYVKRMGFVDENGHGSSWVAVRHGLSAKGNDHVHVMVNLVRNDGSWASEHKSKLAADRIGRELEQEFSAFLSPPTSNLPSRVNGSPVSALIPRLSCVARRNENYPGAVRSTRTGCTCNGSFVASRWALGPRPNG